MRLFRPALGAALLWIALVTSASRPSSAQTDAAEVTGAPDASAPAPSSVTPPALLERARPVYPEDGEGRRVDVELLLTINAHGAVVGDEVLGHIPADAPASFDRAAREATARARFRPAMQDGHPIAVRVRFHLAVAPPVVAMTDGGSVVAPTSPPDASASAPPPEVPEELGTGTEGVAHAHAPDDAGARADASAANPPPEGVAEVHSVAPRERTASEFILPVGTLAAVPRTNGGELLSLAPGVVLANEGTEGHAYAVFLRGFTGDNGQDIAFSLDGVPLNEESNVHGQGYADLFFVIPELVLRLDVTEGVADPRQGNFAVAGSIDYHLGLHERGALLRATYGAFGYARVLGVWGPRGADERTFAGVELTHSDGFGPNRAFDRASLIAQQVVELGNGVTGRVMVSGYASRWQAPGVVRGDDCPSSGCADAVFFGSYPTAQFQGGFSTHATLVGALEWHRERERAELRVWGRLRELRISENFTGYANDPIHGDLTEQHYGGGTLGANGYYHRTWQLGGRAQEGELGWFVRHDRFALEQQSLDAMTNAPLVPASPDAFAAGANVTNLALYLDATVRPLAFLALRGGVRLDALAYDVAPDTTATLTAAHQDAFGVHVGPKATLEATLAPGLLALASFGNGFRSPDAMTVATAAGAVPFATVTTEELGLRYTLPRTRARSAQLSATLAAFHTVVDHDLVFDPLAGATVPIGPSQRLGATAWTRVSPWRWLDLNASFTYTYATALADALGGALMAGAPLPYVPVWVGRLDAAADEQVARVGAMPLRLRGGLGITAQGPRALLVQAATALPPAFTDPFALLDAQAGVRLGPVALDLAVRNAFDARWRDQVFEFVSNFHPGTPNGAPVQAFNAGAPRTVMLTLSLYL